MIYGKLYCILQISSISGKKGSLSLKCVERAVDLFKYVHYLTFTCCVLSFTSAMDVSQFLPDYSLPFFPFVVNTWLNFSCRFGNVKSSPPHSGFIANVLHFMIRDFNKTLLNKYNLSLQPLLQYIPHPLICDYHVVHWSMGSHFKYVWEEKSGGLCVILFKTLMVTVLKPKTGKMCQTANCHPCHFHLP